MSFSVSEIVIMPVNKNSEIVEGTLSQPTAETNQALMLRRSKRKRNAIPSTSTTAAKKPRKSMSIFSSLVPVPSLITLPCLVLRKLLLYCDVDTLEKLSTTCSYFDQLISGRFITSLDFPLALDFINEVAATSRLEKKPLLKICCKKSDEKLLIPSFSEYMFHSQLAFLSLHKIRELDLVPEDLSKIHAMNHSTRMKYLKFDSRLLHHIKR